MPLLDVFVYGIRLPFTVSAILKNLSIQRSFLQKHVEPILSHAKLKNDGSLDISDFKKITDYYGLAVPAILGEAFCGLHGKKMNESERMAATAQGAMTGLFDDFFDKASMSDSAIESILENDDQTTGNSNEILFNHFYKTALQNVPDKKKMQRALQEVYKAQVESKKQTQETVSEKEIIDISFYKGGASLVFYRSAFTPAASQEEQELIYGLGSLMQLANDIFDVYKDRENGIKTLITEASHIKPVRQILQHQIDLYYSSAYKIGFPKKNARKFLSILSIGVFSRAFVCLDQLEKNEQSTNGIFAVQQYTRKQLICDMDTKSNMLRSGWYHIKLLASQG
jgi:hypothetical protein